MFSVGLPWYDLEIVRPHIDNFWSHFRFHLIEEGIKPTDLPRTLDRECTFLDQWLSPQLLLSQACGYDVVAGFGNHLQIVAAPSFSLKGLKPGRYYSYIVTSDANDGESLVNYQGKTIVINSKQSHSGMNALVSVIACEAQRLDLFSNVLVSGSHEASIEMIKRGQADLAAIDCITFNMLLKHDPSRLQGVRILMRTPDATSPPYVTSYSQDVRTVNIIQRALRKCFDNSYLKETLEALLLKDIVIPTVDDYLPMLATDSDRFLEHYKL